jgi:ParB/RepB/Spo0J family partition protein
MSNLNSPQIDESKIFELDPTEVIIKEGLPRQRKDLGEIEKMAESIRIFGQLQPVVINRNNELIAGGRRLAACLIGGFKVRVCYKDTVDTVTMREMELEENLQRKALTPAEESLAVSELVELKRSRLGTPTQGRTGGYTLEDAAEAVGKTKGYVVEALKIADAVKMFPELAKCGTKTEIKSAVKGLERAQQQVAALATYEETIKKTSDFVLVNRDAEGWLKGLGENTVDLLFTDPPYGIDIFDIAMTTGGHTGGEQTTTGTKFDDSPEHVLPLLEILVKESYRVVKDTGHALIFCAPSYFSWLSEKMKEAGWLVAPRPVVWIKRESGQNNQPEKWFSSAYEFILFARKVNSHLVLQGRPDWIQCDPVLPSERVHAHEKPLALCKELIARCCMPGQYLIDPFMGSGAIIEAGVQMKVLSLGCEKSIESYASAAARMTKDKKI